MVGPRSRPLFRATACFALAVGLSTPSERAAAESLDLSRGDPRRGKRLFITCRACHNTRVGEPHKEGPNLTTVFGSRVASKPDFKYSIALERARFIWTPEKLAEWVAKPGAFVPGNRMAFLGLSVEQDRLDLLAYLIKETAGASGGAVPQHPAPDQTAELR